MGEGDLGQKSPWVGSPSQGLAQHSQLLREPGNFHTQLPLKQKCNLCIITTTELTLVSSLRAEGLSSLETSLIFKISICIQFLLMIQSIGLNVSWLE